MKLGVASIIRFEDDHFVEWFAYYLMHGVEKFVIYNHSMPGDPPDITRDWILKLQKYYDIDHKDITGYNIYDAYQTIMDGPRMETDWLMWADADEYYFPLEKETIKEVLEDYDQYQISALGIYWSTFGGGGLIEEPKYCTQGFTKRATHSHTINHHVKPIVKGKHAGKVKIVGYPHVYDTEFGTFDLEGRHIPVHCGLNQGPNCPGVPCHNIMKINHYSLKSWSWFKKVKQLRGPGDRPPDAPGGYISDDWYKMNQEFVNSEEESLIWDRYGNKIIEKIEIVKEQLGI